MGNLAYDDIRNEETHPCPREDEGSPLKPQEPSVGIFHLGSLCDLGCLLVRKFEKGIP